MTGRFAVGIKADGVLTQLVVRPAVAAHGGCAGSAIIRARPGASAAGNRNALRTATRLRNALAAAPLATVTLPRVLPKRPTLDTALKTKKEALVQATNSTFVEAIETTVSMVVDQEVILVDMNFLSGATWLPLSPCRGTATTRCHGMATTNLKNCPCHRRGILSAAPPGLEQRERSSIGKQCLRDAVSR